MKYPNEKDLNFTLGGNCFTAFDLLNRAHNDYGTELIYLHRSMTNIKVDHALNFDLMKKYFLTKFQRLTRIH